ncbi:MAG: hypothetical protein MUO68_05810 [Desulfobacteraceae bacterium]|nr:hypothetical protein [Desulfobacteraceae bacterium]
MVSETVRKIEGILTETEDLQRDYVKRICVECEAHCCSRVHYLFNEKDILFLKLSGRKLRWRREIFAKKGCWFLGEQGCILDPECRPFICHTYICDNLKMDMKRCDSGLIALLEGKFKVIGEMRSQLWAEYLDEKI